MIPFFPVIPLWQFFIWCVGAAIILVIIAVRHKEAMKNDANK